jgi:hypothetical protein
MKRIKLTKDKYAIVSDEDYESLNKYKWYATDCRIGDREKWYAARKKKIDGTYKTVYMHREITNCPQGLVVDHLNANGLDNQRTNLENVTQEENLKRWHNKAHLKHTA